MTYGSVCSGIEAASVAWKPLGWRCAFVSEIEPFPKRVLAHHYPDVPDLGDFTKIGAEHGPVDLLVGGTPCQSFSVAGLRQGLADPRGNLMLEFGALARRLRARWLVWENVPGVLSSNGGRDFAAFLGMLGELGYGFAYRVLDAQYVRTHEHPRAVPQRRRRVFVVGHSGGLWQRAAAVLFEPQGLRGDPAPRREAGERPAPTLDVRAGRSGETTFHTSGGLVPAISGTLEGRQSGGAKELNGVPLIAHALTGEGFDASEDGTGRGTPLVPVVAGSLTAGLGMMGASDNGDPSKNGALIVWDGAQITSKLTRLRVEPGRPSVTLNQAAQATIAYGFPWKSAFASSPTETCPTQTKSQVMAVAYSISPGACGTPEGQEDIFVNRSEVSRTLDQLGADPTRKQGGTMICAPSLTATNDPSRSPQSSEVTAQVEAVHASSMAVRRLTPVECARLQGFPDHFLDIPGSSDSAKYRALGNSMAVPVMAWIGRRIDMVERASEPGEGAP